MLLCGIPQSIHMCCGQLMPIMVLYLTSFNYHLVSSEIPLLPWVQLYNHTVFSLLFLSVAVVWVLLLAFLPACGTSEFSLFCAYFCRSQNFSLPLSMLPFNLTCMCIVSILWNLLLDNVICILQCCSISHACVHVYMLCRSNLHPEAVTCIQKQ